MIFSSTKSGKILVPLVATLFFALFSCQDKKEYTQFFYLQVGEQFVAADRNMDNALIANRETAGHWETFRLQKNKDNSWLLIASDSSFVGLDEHRGILKAGFKEQQQAMPMVFDTLELNFISLKDIRGAKIGTDSIGNLTLDSKIEKPIRIHTQSLKFMEGFPESNWIQLYSICLLLFLSLYFFRHTTHKKLALLLLFVGAFALRLWVALLNPHLELWDEQFHALVAKNMMEKPFAPMLYKNPELEYEALSWAGGHIWLHKQPLFLWQMAASMKVFGVNTFGLRFPSVLMSSIIVLFIFRIGKLLINEKSAFYGAFFFAFGNFILEITAGAIHTDHNDVAFLFYVAASIWALVEYEHSQEKKKQTMLLIFIGLFAGCAILTKWLTGLLVFSGWGLFILSQSKKRYNWRSYLPLFLAAFIAIAIALPWQVYAFLNFTEIYLHENLYNARHFTEVIEGHGGDFFYHFNHFIKIYGFNFLLFLPAIVIFLFKINSNPWKWALGAYIVLIYLFFSIAATKMIAFTLCISFLVFLSFGTFFDFFFDKISTKMKTNSLQKPVNYLKTLLLCAFAYFLLNPAAIEELHTLENKDNGNFLAKRIHSSTQIYGLNKDFDLSADYVVFNFSNSDNIPAMFFNDLRAAYLGIPTEAEIQKLHAQKLPIAVFIDAHSPAYILEDRKIKKLPHYDVTRYYPTPHQ